jgi:GAF domain-containing protein
VFEVHNAIEDVRFKGNPFVKSAPDIRFYAASVLQATNGAPLGTLCVIDMVPKTLTLKQKQLLALLARQIETELETRATVLEMRAALAQAVSQNELTELLLTNAVPAAIVKCVPTRACVIGAHWSCVVI